MLEKQKNNFYWECIPKSVLSATTLAYSDICSKFYLLLIQFTDEYLCVPLPKFFVRLQNCLHQNFSLK